MRNLSLFENQERQPPRRRLCPGCGNNVPADLLFCPICVHQASNRAVRAFQHMPLRNVAAGHGRLTERIIGQKRHLQMFGAEVTFCGLDISDGRPRTWVSYHPEALRGVCEKCRAGVEEILDETSPA